MAYLVFGKLLYQLCHFYATGQILTIVNGQRLNSNIAIWSHWSSARNIWWAFVIKISRLVTYPTFFAQCYIFNFQYQERKLLLSLIKNPTMEKTSQAIAWSDITVRWKRWFLFCYLFRTTKKKRLSNKCASKLDNFWKAIYFVAKVDQFLGLFENCHVIANVKQYYLSKNCCGYILVNFWKMGCFNRSFGHRLLSQKRFDYTIKLLTYHLNAIHSLRTAVVCTIGFMNSQAS